MNLKKNLYLYLSFSGAIPFVICALLIPFNLLSGSHMAFIEKVASTYGLTILAFMAGTHWGVQINREDRWSIFLPISSNLITLLACGFYLSPFFRGFVAILILGFTLLLWIDKKLYQAGLLNQDYFYTRCWVTLIVGLSLMLIGICA